MSICLSACLSAIKLENDRTDFNEISHTYLYMAILLQKIGRQQQTVHMMHVHVCVPIDRSRLNTLSLFYQAALISASLRSFRLAVGSAVIAAIQICPGYGFTRFSSPQNF
jgi:hypothetical protein